MIVPYSKFHSDAPGLACFWRPILDVKFFGGPKPVKVSCLVDSGSDTTLLHKDYAAELGLQWDAGIKSKTFGIEGNEAPMYLHEVEFEVINLKASKRRITLGFVDLSNVHALLGQQGFFENFIVRFRYREKMFAVDVPEK
jgi:hypothetical protein